MIYILRLNIDISDTLYDIYSVLRLNIDIFRHTL